MAIRKYKPTSAGRRHRTVSDFADITTTKPHKPLLEPIKKKGGRNFHGKITARHRGGGHKRRYRVIDFKRNKLEVPGKVATIEYDPNRSARIALIHYADGEKRYILAPLGLEVGDEILASAMAVDPRAGNCMPLRHIPPGMPIHNIEMHRGKGGQMIRSAGTAAHISAKEGNFAHLTMPSGEIRLVHLDCVATVGQVGNLDHQQISGGKTDAPDSEQTPEDKPEKAVDSLPSITPSLDEELLEEVEPEALDELPPEDEDEAAKAEAAEKEAKGAKEEPDKDDLDQEEPTDEKLDPKADEPRAEPKAEEQPTSAKREQQEPEGIIKRVTGWFRRFFGS